jgi:hypothetical protein
MCRSVIRCISHWPVGPRGVEHNSSMPLKPIAGDRGVGFMEKHPHYTDLQIYVSSKLRPLYFSGEDTEIMSRFKDLQE